MLARWAKLKMSFTTNYVHVCFEETLSVSFFLCSNSWMIHTEISKALTHLPHVAVIMQVRRLQTTYPTRRGSWIISVREYVRALKPIGSGLYSIMSHTPNSPSPVGSQKRFLIHGDARLRARALEIMIQPCMACAHARYDHLICNHYVWDSYDIDT